MASRLIRLATFGLALLALAAPMPAGAAPTFGVQGALGAGGGVPASDGKYPMTFRIYATKDATTAVFAEVQVGVNVTGGLFAVTLGAQPELPLPATAFQTGDPLWMGVQIYDEPELPRVRLHFVPYAIFAANAGTATNADNAAHATLADVATQAESLTKPITGDLIAPGSLGASAVGFTYAASDSKGGSALAAKVAESLQCTGCVTVEMLAPGLLDAKNVTFSAVDPAITVEAELIEVVKLTAALHAWGKQVGVGAPPAAACALDVVSSVGETCIDGAPALWTRLAKDAAGMDAFATDGQLVYRKDTGESFMRSNGLWRRLVYAPYCGDGAIEAWEECDDGKNNANAPDKCRTTCKKPTCGDAIADSGEQCDDGNSANGDGCVQGCKKAVCGDGFVYAGVEECDDGANNGNAPDKCRPACTKPVCGDAIVDTGEQCDDGNKTDNDLCNNSCVKNVNVWTVVLNTSKAPTIVAGTIPGVVGKSIVINRIGMCGDSDVSSGDNRFLVQGGGVDFSFTAGQTATSATHDLGVTGPGGAGFTYADVTYTASQGASVTITWDYHNDWDYKPCVATDSEGNAYNDASTAITSVRPWIRYGYK